MSQSGCLKGMKEECCLLKIQLEMFFPLDKHYGCPYHSWPNQTNTNDIFQYYFVYRRWTYGSNVMKRSYEESSAANNSRQRKITCYLCMKLFDKMLNLTLHKQTAHGIQLSTEGKLTGGAQKE